MTQTCVAENSLLVSYPSDNFNPHCIPTTAGNSMITYSEPNAPLTLSTSRPASSTNTLDTASLVLHGSALSPTPLVAGLVQGLPSKPLPSHSNLNYHSSMSGSPQPPSVMSHDDIASGSGRAYMSPTSQSWLWATDAGTCSGFTIPSRSLGETSFGQVQHIQASSSMQSPWPLEKPPLQIPAQVPGHSWWTGQLAGERTTPSNG